MFLMCSFSHFIAICSCPYLGFLSVLGIPLYNNSRICLNVQYLQYCNFGRTKLIAATLLNALWTLIPLGLREQLMEIRLTRVSKRDRTYVSRRSGIRMNGCLQSKERTKIEIVTKCQTDFGSQCFLLHPSLAQLITTVFFLMQYS